MYGGFEVAMFWAYLRSTREAKRTEMQGASGTNVVHKVGKHHGSSHIESKNLVDSSGDF